MVFCAGLSVAQAAPIRMGFLCPAPEDHPFWGMVVQGMRAAAKDLQVELVVKCDEHRTTYTVKKLGAELLDAEPRLDFFLSGYWTAVTKYHLEQARERNIRVFIFNADVIKADRQSVGLPRQHYPNWIGQMVPDDYAASITLTRLLVDHAIRARRHAADGKIHVVGLSTTAVAASGNNRSRGLLEQAGTMQGVTLHEIVAINRDAGSARDLALEALRKYPDVSVLWASSEAGAKGAVEAVELLNKKPGKDVFIGGFDWNPDNLQALADGRITASMFGHFLEGAWALILAHDFHHGFDFVEQTGVRINTPLKVMNADNIERYKDMLDPGFWEKVDFRKYSKKYNPQLKAYDFSVEQFITQ
jgi:ABC-type sugar transport system substrate-binding protein